MPRTGHFRWDRWGRWPGSEAPSRRAVVSGDRPGVSVDGLDPRQQTNQLRSTLRAFYPAALEAFADLTHPDALEVLRIAPTPEQGTVLSKANLLGYVATG